MAKEITVQCSLNVNNGFYSDSFASGSPQFDQTTLLSSSGVLQIGTAIETLSLGEVTAAGYAVFRNLSTATAGTAYVALGAYVGTTLHEFAALRRGMPALLPLRSDVSVGARAYGEPVRMQFIVLSE